MYTYSRLPYTARLSFQLLLLFFIGLLIYWCRPVVVPAYFSLLLGILVLPLNNYFEKRQFGRALSAFLAVFIAILVLTGIFYFLSTQISNFLKDVPTIRTQLEAHYATLQNWVADRFNIDPFQQAAMFNKVTAGMRSIPDYVEQMFLSATQTITFITIVAVCAFLIIYYKTHIRNFFLALFRNKENVDAVTTGSKEVIKNYMQGLVIEMFIVAILNAALLLLIGIKYAIFLGVFAAIVNIIPFIGIFTGIVFTVLITLTTPASMGQIFWVIAGLSIIHFFDSNIIMPKIVGSKVKVNALITIIAALMGGALMGLGGVFLALPTVAILKIIFDRVEELKPWSILLGDESGHPSASKPIKRKISLDNDQ